MNTTQYITRALETESRIPTVVADVVVFNQTKHILENAGEVLDQIKKQVYYGKPFTEKFDTAVEAVRTASAEYVQAQSEPRPTKINPRLFHGVVGAITETIELLQALDLDNEEVDAVNLLEEVGDVMWYLAIIVDELGQPFERVFQANINKLEKRNKQRQFNADATINRDVDSERAQLEADLNI